MGVKEMEASVVQQPSTSRWSWECESPPPSLTPEQASMLETTIAEVQASPLCSGAAVANGGRTAVWRYLEGAQWRLEPVRGKRVSEFFLETLAWRQDGGVDTVLDRAHTFVDEASSGKLFVRGTSLLGRPLIWVHAGWEDGASGPEASLRFLVYTVERAIASMEPETSTGASKGQFCVVIDCTATGGDGQLPSLAFVREAVSMLMLRYPSRLGNLFIVNAGNMVYYLWRAVSLLLSPVTREKVVVVSGTEQQQRELLLQHISEDALEGGRLGLKGAPPFHAESYLKGGDAGGGKP
ncbi:conserved unknown protein [Ectocarpus siliculosus]|uniref:CRAL-TRIO domain-containing protein n=1 Tax=Ectocarpus siliculosus TaxID=2880 RepID=D8LGX4_ECTSI|nr:conserved unknown protein [Ectocarpus siliculosus]|eukprot:CBN75827.1 conserved unknown protein [Ectocarpus siliculosus]